MKIFADKRLLSLGTVCGTASRHAGNMKEPQNQATLFGQLGIPQQHILHLHQTHSQTILPILTPEDAAQTAARPVQEADGWILKPTGWGAAILTADCVPLFVWDQSATLVGLAHCGWRGVAGGLPFKLAQEMQKHGARGPLCAYTGPHIQNCCFEVQADVEAAFSSTCIIKKDGKTYVDLSLEVRRQLAQAGLTQENIRTPYYCTCGDKENFFSWRRDHERVNMLSFIYKP